MKSTGVIALVAAGVVAGGGIATYQLTRPSDEPVRVTFVDPASNTTPTSEPTPASVTPTATSTATKAPVAVTSSSTTHKATVRKEATVSQPSETGPGRVVTDPPAADDPIRNTPPPPVPGNKPKKS